MWLQQSFAGGSSTLLPSYMGSFAEWKARVSRWRIKYGQPQFPKGQFDPSRVTTGASRCQYRSCGVRRKLSRHHKGHEYLFACIDEELYAARYLEFRDEDCVTLCRRHHTYIHRKYDSVVSEVSTYIKACGGKMVGGRLRFHTSPSHATLESYRLRLVGICDRWLAGKRGPRLQPSLAPKNESKT